MFSLSRKLGIKWDDYFTKMAVLERTNFASLVHALWTKTQMAGPHLSYARQIPKDILFGELVQESNAIGLPHLRFKYAWKRDMKAVNRKQIDYRKHPRSAHLVPGSERIYCRSWGEKITSRWGEKREGKR